MSGAQKWLPFVVQQISVATQLAMAQEIAEALWVCRLQRTRARRERR